MSVFMYETFSSSCRSCLLLASLEHRFCSGATTVQIQRPSASCAELYTCHPSFGPIVCKHNNIRLNISAGAQKCVQYVHIQVFAHQPQK